MIKIFKRYFVFFIMLGLSLVYILLISGNIITTPDSQSYINTSLDLTDTLIRPLGYPLLIKFFGLKLLVLLQALMCAIIFQIAYDLSGTIIILALTGAYIIYVPFIISDLSFSFFVIVSFYYLINYKYNLHILFIGIASLIKPTLAWFFVAEFIIVWFYSKNFKQATVSMILCFIATSVMPVYNLIINGVYTHSQILSIGINDYYFADAENKFGYMIYSVFSNQTNTHWNYFLHIFGIGKGISDNILVNALTWIFCIFYVCVWLRFLVLMVYTKQYFKLIWVFYFVSPTIFAHSGGGRWRLPFEFLIF